MYDRLSPSFAKYLETLEAVHEARFFRQIADIVKVKLRDGEVPFLEDLGKVLIYVGERGSPGNVGSHLEAVHPVIR